MGLRVGIVGAGRVTEEYWLPALSDLGARTWLYDKDAARLRSLCRGLLVRPGDSVEALTKKVPDLVIVATPARTHATVAGRIADACAPGRFLRVLLEKPPVVSVAELRGLLDRQSEGRIRPYGAFLRRFLPAPQLARRMFDDWRRRFGALEHVEIWEGRPWGWRSQGTRGGTAGLESMLFDEFAHAVDLALFVIGAEAAEPTKALVGENTALRFTGACDLEVGGDVVGLRLRGCRDRALSNMVAFRFRSGSVSVEQGFSGGIVVRPDDAPPEPMDSGAGPSLRSVFGSMATIAARAPEQQPDSRVPPLAMWGSALGILESLSDRSPVSPT